MRRFATTFAAVAALLITASCASKPPQRPIVTGPAPDSFRVTFNTSRGPFVVQVTRAWAPLGADRFFQLVQSGFFDENRFFRVVPGFVAQFGINDKPAINNTWDAKRIPDDSVRQTNARGTLVFATEGPQTRSHQLFINLADNARLDPLGFAPIGRVVEGMNAVDSIYNGYADEPDQHFIQTLGNSYLARMFPKLDFIKTATVAPIGSH
ncbi:MAG TPA: peptidylprolyl isomerase [Gemmatimonadaceae bacterium]|jgi:peptidyl-prolyl cis-trans isomerase A (cyclophilin A)